MTPEAMQAAPTAYQPAPFALLVVILASLYGVGMALVRYHAIRRAIWRVVPFELAAWIMALFPTFLAAMAGTWALLLAFGQL